MRASRFLVAADTSLSDQTGEEIRVVLQSATGQVYLLPNAIYELITSNPDALPTSVMDELAAADLLVADDRDEFAEVVAENIAALRNRSERTFVLMPAAYCNMGCGYCGQQHVRLPKTEQHRDAVRRRLLLAAGAPGTSAINVSWFGAEPMMGYAQILDLSASVIAACAEAGIEYQATMVTNGSLLTLAKLRRLYHEAKVTSFEITLDGPPARHNAQRRLKSGRPSFDHIVATIRAACQEDDLADLQFTIRTNISRANQHEAREFASAVVAAGLAHPKVYFYTAFVREWGNDVSDYAVAAEDVVQVERQWLDAYREYGLRGGDLPIARKRQVCVTVARQDEVIAPTGELYSCTEQPLVPSRSGTHIGHVTALQTPEYRPAGSMDSWNESLLDPSTEAYCPSCAIFPICGGHCPLVWSEGKPACPSVKMTLPMELGRYGESLGLQPTAS